MAVLSYHNDTAVGLSALLGVTRQQTENDMQLEPFWLVWNRQGYNPTIAHPTLDAATKEAERLARENKGQPFVVLESVAALVVNNIQRIDLRPAKEPPFDA